MATAVATLMLAPAATAAGSDDRPIDNTAATLIAGDVVRDGAPAQAQVVLVAWPTQATAESLKPGDRVPNLALAATETGPDGRFVFDVPSNKLPKAFVSESGQVNVELLIKDQKSEIRWSTSLTKIDDNGGSWTLTALKDAPEGFKSGSRSTPTFDLETGAINDPVINVADVGDPLDARSGIDSAVASAEHVAVNSPTGLVERYVQSIGEPLEDCYYQLRDYTYNVRENFAHVQGTVNARASLTLTSGNEHTLGVAFAAGDDNWTQSGTETFSSSVSRTMPDTASAWVVGNRVVYANYANICGPPYGKYSHPDGLEAPLTDQLLVSRLSYGYCWDYVGGSLSKEDGVNGTVEGGVEFQGVGLSAQAGWTTSVTQFWEFAGNATSTICANRSTLDAASRVVAQVVTQ